MTPAQFTKEYLTCIEQVEQAKDRGYFHFKTIQLLAAQADPDQLGTVLNQICSFIEKREKLRAIATFRPSREPYQRTGRISGEKKEATNVPD